jgi:hypothetical protein
MGTRRSFWLLLGAMALTPSPTNAQEPRNALSADLFLPLMSPVSQLAGEKTAWVPLNVKYQRVITDHLALMAKVGLTYSWGSDGESSLEVYPMLALDWHPFDTGLRGFYVGPSVFFNYSWHDDDVPDPAATDHSYWAAVGGNLGWQFVVRSRYVIDVTFGLGYGYSAEVDRSGKVTSSYTLDETIGGVFVGFRF